jgi:hypothetical protein
MSSWFGMLVIVAGLWLGAVVARGVIDGVNWLIDVLVREPREREKLARRTREWKEKKRQQQDIES